MSTPIDAETAVRDTRAWVRTMVIGLQLCPFAKTVEEGGRLRYAACTDSDREAAYRFYLEELERLVQADSDTLETSLLIFPNLFADFDDYLDFLATAEDCIEQAELEGIVQVASFHPQYYFADTDPADVSNYTNRSPYPILHLLREDSLTVALEHFLNPDSIPERNIRLMREMGEEQVKALLAKSRQP